MADKTEVFFESVRNKNSLLKDANNFALQELAITGTTSAKRFANFNKGYQTGETKNSIQYRLANNRNGGFNDSTGKQASRKIDTPEKGTAVVGATTNHAVYLEFGTRKMEPQPFLRPSLSELAGKSKEIIQKEMDDSIKDWKLWKEKL